MEPPTKRAKLEEARKVLRPCHPFDRDRPAPDEKERKRLYALDQDGDEWCKERLLRMGASSCSCAAGLGPATPWDYWRLKTHRIVREDTPGGQRIMQRGHTLEPLAADAYEKYMHSGPLVQVGIVVHPTIPWIHCSPDRLIRDNPRGIVEIKCPVYGLPIRIPDKYMCQVQQQMQVLQVDWCDLFYYYHDDERDRVSGIKCWRIWRNDAYWSIMLRGMQAMANCLMEDRCPTEKDISLRPRMPAVRTSLVLERDFVVAG